MSRIKEIFSRRVLRNACIFSAPVSAVLLLRICIVTHTAYFSAAALRTFAILFAVGLLLYIAMFAILTWLAERKQQDD